MRLSLTTPQHIAKRVEAVMDMAHPPQSQLVGFDGHIFSMFRRLAPRGVYHAIVGSLLFGRNEWSRRLQEESRKIPTNLTQD